MSNKKSIPVIKIMVSGLLLSWLIYSLDLVALRDVFLRAKLDWLLTAVLFIVVSMIVSTEKWLLVLQAGGINLPWFQVWKAYWTGLFFNNFLPSSIGGDGIRVFIIGREISNMAGAASSVIIERLLATIGLALTGLTAGLVARASWQVTWLFFVLIVTGLSLLSFLVWGRVPAWAAQKEGRILAFIRGFLYHGQALRSQGKMILIVGGLSILFQLTVVAINYAIFRGLNVDVLNWWDLVYVVPAISAIAMVPVGVNGYGVREGAYVFLLASYGVAKSTALGASLLYAILVSICSLYGGILWLAQRERGVEEGCSWKTLTQ